MGFTGFFCNLNTQERGLTIPQLEKLIWGSINTPQGNGIREERKNIIDIIACYSPDQVWYFPVPLGLPTFTKPLFPCDDNSHSMWHPLCTIYGRSFVRLGLDRSRGWFRLEPWQISSDFSTFSLHIINKRSIVLFLMSLCYMSPIHVEWSWMVYCMLFLWDYIS